MLSLRKRMGALLLTTLTISAMLASHKLHAQQKVLKVSNWIDWNGSFKAGYSTADRQSVIDDLTSQIAAFSRKPIEGIYPKKGKITSSLRKQAKKFRNKVLLRNIVYQPCNNGDSLLWNIRADAEIEGADSTTSGSGSTSPKPVVKPQGQALNRLEMNYIIKNRYDSIIHPVRPEAFLAFDPKPVINDNVVIAVLDSGIDTMNYEPGMRSEILWHGPAGSKNMKRGSDVNNYLDDDVMVHGTSVAAIALNSFYLTSGKKQIPKLMVVKVLDSLGIGTVFELCCGIRYATANHATVINASLGYTSSENSVFSDAMLKDYLGEAHVDSIPVVAAAGNSDSSLNMGRACLNSINDANRITDRNIFLPAGLASDETNFTVISVTGFSQAGMPCFLQKFSETYITLGVLNEQAETNCCRYKLPFLGGLVHGSSYATPVVSGRLAYNLSVAGHHGSISDYMRQMRVVNAPTGPGIQTVTQSNQYITY